MHKLSQGEVGWAGVWEWDDDFNALAVDGVGAGPSGLAGDGLSACALADEDGVIGGGRVEVAGGAGGRLSGLAVLAVLPVLLAFDACGEVTEEGAACVGEGGDQECGEDD